MYLNSNQGNEMRVEIKLKSMKEPVMARIQKDTRREGMLKATYMKSSEKGNSMVCLVGEKYQAMIQEAINK